MSELNLLDNEVHEAAIIYGEKFYKNDFPILEPSTGTSFLSEEPLTKGWIKVWNSSVVIHEDQQVRINDWPENEDSLTQADLLNDEENQVQELIFQIRKSFTITYHERLARRLLTLFNDAKEEDSDSLGISVGSLRNFYSFFGLHVNLKYPAISLTPDCNIYTSWRGEKNQVFSVHFLPNENTRFVIFKPNDKHPELKIRLSGTATNDTLLKTIESSGVRDWISE